MAFKHVVSPPNEALTKDHGKERKTAREKISSSLRSKKLEELQALKSYFESINANHSSCKKQSFASLIKSILF